MAVQCANVEERFQQSGLKEKLQEEATKWKVKMSAGEKNKWKKEEENKKKEEKDR